MADSAETPSLTPLGDMDLRIGQTVQLITRGKHPSKYYTRLIGHVEHEFIMLRVPVENGWAVPLVDVGPAEDGAKEEELDDLADDDGGDDLSPPHPVSATLTARVVTVQPAAVIDICFTMSSSTNLLTSSAT